MIRRRLKVTAILLLALATIGAGQDSIHFSGSAIPASDWTVAQIQNQLASEIKPVEYTSRGAKHTFSCVPLVTLLKAAGAQTDFTMQPGAGPRQKNQQMRVVVVVSGRDGYAVVFSLAELLPMVGGRTVWVALDEDGKPLADSDGPARLIVPDDKMPARGVHQIGAIEVEELSGAATQPASP